MGSFLYMCEHTCGWNVYRFGAELCDQSLAYTLAPTVGHYLPLHSRKCLATGAHAQESPPPCRVDRFSSSCTAHLREWRKQNNNTHRGCSGASSWRNMHTTYSAPHCQDKHRTRPSEQRFLCAWNAQPANECSLCLLTYMFSNRNLVYWIPPQDWVNTIC